MRIGIDVSPLETGHFLQHRVRGTGFYLEHLKKALLKYLPENEYTFYTRSEKLSNNLDLVHIPYFEPFFLTLPNTNKVKTVVTVHDLTPLVFSKEFPSGVKGKLRWILQKSRLKKADHIVTDSESSKKDIVKYIGVGQDKVSVVYLAAGEEFIKLKASDPLLETVKKKYNLPEHFSLYVGDVTWNKNLPRIIKATKKADSTLFIVGKAVTEDNFDKSNPWNKDLVSVRQMIKENENVKTLGFVSTEDLVAIYNLADVFVMPSLYEGFGLPILEAMACGCPVLTSKEGSLEEVAGDAAYYVDAYDEESIAEGIRTLEKDEKLRSKLSEKGLGRAKKFSWEQTAKDTVSAYKKALNQ